MAVCVERTSEEFVYTYSAPRREEVEKIRNRYLPKEESKYEQLVRLDKQTNQKGKIRALTLGILGSLILGVGMCLVMVWNTGSEMIIAGSAIGIVGMVIMGFAYPVYKKKTKKEREKVADQIIELSNELL